MTILAIETSCDETGAAVLRKDRGSVSLLSNALASSLALHEKTGGVIPEIAAREQIRYIIPVIEQALKDAKLWTPNSELKTPDIDAIAITVGPGLIGSLLVGVETAKILAYVWKKPLIPVNHLIGHVYANWLRADSIWQIEKPQAIRYKPSATILFPAIGLIVSGGHTDLILLKQHGDIQWLGGTRDDAAGEAFDKIGRLLGLSAYPAGPAIEKAALHGDPKRFVFPKPLYGSKDYDFSFSGLKTSVFNTVKKQNILDEKTIADIAYATEDAIVSVLVAKTIRAVKEYNASSLLLGGGVTANTKLRKQLALEIRNLKFEIGLFVPPARLCTDNAAMIGAAACFISQTEPLDSIQAQPELYFV